MILSQVSGMGGGRVYVYLTCRETAGPLKVFSVMIISQVSGKGGGRVYVYLTRYAEEQQDLALLSISTFQRALKVLNVIII